MSTLADLLARRGRALRRGEGQARWGAAHDSASWPCPRHPKQARPHDEEEWADLKKEPEEESTREPMVTGGHLGDAAATQEKWRERHPTASP